jgi:hypothetical protein
MAALRTANDGSGPVHHHAGQAFERRMTGTVETLQLFVFQNSFTHPHEPLFRDLLYRSSQTSSIRHPLKVLFSIRVSPFTSGRRHVAALM